MILASLCLNFGFSGCLKQVRNACSFETGDCAMEPSPGLPQDTKSLRSCSRNQAKMLLKVILESNVTSDSFSTVPPVPQ